MEKAVIVYTPLHLLNALKYICSNNLKGRFVLYYISQNEQMDRYLVNLKKEQIFSRVFSATRKELAKNQKFWEIAGAVIPGIYVTHLFGKGSVGNEYEEVLFSVPTRAIDCILSCNKYGSLSGFDDGLGSYIGDVMNTSLGDKYSAVANLMHHKSHHAGRLLLSNPAFYMGDSRIPVEPLYTKLLPQDEETILRIFGYDQNENYKNFNMIFLNQPLADFHDSPEHKKTEQKILACINEKKAIRCAVRLHPRETEYEIYDAFHIDSNKNMWELMCGKAVNEELCLISAFSTAQFMPKLLRDSEPKLIFTFLLYSDFTDQERKRYMKLCEKLKSTYSNPTDVSIPSDFEELNGILESMKV